MFGRGSLYSSLPDYRNPAARDPSSMSRVEIDPTLTFEVEARMRCHEAEIALLRQEFLQAKDQHLAEIVQIHRSHAEQIQRLTDMQRPLQVQHTLPINNSYTSLLKSTTAAFVGFANHPTASTQGISTSFAFQAGHMPMSFPSPTCNPSIHHTLTDPSDRALLRSGCSSGSASGSTDRRV